MLSFLVAVMDELERVAPGSPVILVNGCALPGGGIDVPLFPSDAPRGLFKKQWYCTYTGETDLSKPIPFPEMYEKVGNRPETYIYQAGYGHADNALMSEELRKHGVIYWFADFQDTVGEEEAKKVLKCLKARNQKLYVHPSGNTGAFVQMVTEMIAVPSGGGVITEEVK